MCVCVRECLCVCVRLSLFKFKGKTESQTSKLDECVCVSRVWLLLLLNLLTVWTASNRRPVTVDIVGQQHQRDTSFFYSVIALFLNDLARLVNLLGKPHFLHGPMIMGVLRLRSESRLSTAVSYKFFLSPPPLPSSFIQQTRRSLFARLFLSCTLPMDRWIDRSVITDTVYTLPLIIYHQ